MTDHKPNAGEIRLLDIPCGRLSRNYSHMNSKSRVPDTSANTDEKSVYKQKHDVNCQFLFDNMSQGAFYQKADGTLVDVNQAALDMLGLTRDQFLGRTFYDPEWKIYRSDGSFLPPEEHPSVVTLRSGFAINDMEIGVYRPVTSDYVWLIVNTIPQFNPGDSLPYQVIVTLHNITDRRHAEDALKSSEARSKAILDTSPFPVAVVDINDDHIFYWSQSAIDLFGHTADTAHEWYKLAYPDPGYRSEVISRWKPFLEEARETKRPVNTGEYRITCSDGSVRICELYATFIHDNLIVRFNDVTRRKEAENALHVALEYNRTLIESSIDPLMTISPLGKITDVNTATEKITGRQRGELIGTDLTEYFTEPEQAREGYMQTLALEALRDFPLEVKHRDGRIFSVLCNASIYHDNEGKPVGIFASARDVTEKRRQQAIDASRLHLIQYSLAHSLDEVIEEILNETEKLTGSMISFMHFVDDDQDSLVLQDWSHRTKTVFCQAKGKGMHYAISKAGVWMDCVFEHKPVIHNDYESLPNRKGMPEGHARVIREMVVPLIRGEKIRAILGVGNKSVDYLQEDVDTVSDFLELAWEIAERKRVEGALQESEARLRDLNATKDKFFSIIAHDLKNPFNNILGFSELMLESLKDKDYSDLEKLATTIHLSSKRAMDLLTNLLEWSRVQTGRIKFEPENIGIVFMIRQAIELFNEAALEKSITISAKLPLNTIAFADPAMISTVLRNLISNAIKFTHPGGAVVISTRQNQDDLEVSVSDTGIGIAKELIAKLFRIEETYSTAGTRKEQGTGLGLVLCREFVERHGGRIRAESEFGKGSTFSFTLPHAPNA